MKRRSFLKTMASGAFASLADPLVTAQSRLPQERSSRAEGGSHEGRSEVYTASDRVRSGMALGGIGAGTIELRKNGRFYNWNIFNNFPKETGPEFRLPEGEIEDPQAANLFFTVRYQVEGCEPQIKLLQLSNGIYEGGMMGIAFVFPWMQPVDRIEYAARYPFSTLTFSADDMPFDIRMHAWTPFIPHDVKNSSLPLAYSDMSITAHGRRPVDVMLIMTGMNNVGYDTPDRYYITDVFQTGKGSVISMSCAGMDERASSWGQISLSSFSSDSTHYCGWGHRHPYMEYVLRHSELPNLDDTNGTGSLHGTVPDWMPKTSGRNWIDPKTGRLRVHDGRLFCSVARSFRLQGRQTVDHTFAYTWNFPNLHAEKAFREISDVIEGHYYSNFFDSSASVADYAISNRSDLHRRSRQFLDHFFDSSADVSVLEQINSQLNTFATSGRLVKSGEFGVLEGLSSTWSWGPIGTIDVMLYGTAPIIALFPELQKSTMRCHQRAQGADGEIAHGLQKNFQIPEDGTAGVSHRLDLPGQYVILVMRDFFWTDDREYLREMYPSIQRAIHYIVEHRAVPGTQIPLMKGIECSYDNFPMYGYAAYILSQWLCAITCAMQAAEVLGDVAGKARYERILCETRAAMEVNLWNGDYYSLYNDTSRAGGHGGRSEGCLTDQLVGQWSAHQVGIGYLLEKKKIDAALRSILKKSYKPDFGLRNCSWPGTGYFANVDRDIWGDQGNTCWSGVELAFASFLLYEGMHTEAIEVIHTVDSRYRKNGLYFDHQEFGGHYFRPMSAWGIVNGLLGLGINQQHFFFDPQLPDKFLKLFFASPAGTAHFIRSQEGVTLKCLTGSLSISAVTMRGSFQGNAALSGKDIQTERKTSVMPEGKFTQWSFPGKIQIAEGEALQLS
jgi:uncharacterized protein (DUF608 family)